MPNINYPCEKEAVANYGHPTKKVPFDAPTLTTYGKLSEIIQADFVFLSHRHFRFKQSDDKEDVFNSISVAS